MDSLHYIEDASMNAVLLLQKSVFQSQVANLEKLIQQQSKSATEVKGSQHLPNVLTRRTLAEDLQDLRRNADNEELIMMTMLDTSGILSLPSRVTEFMVLMTRLTKVDHRALCIQILANNFSKECETEFVQNGGLRVIKRWIKNAEAEENVEELKRLVKLCKKLPFVAQAIKVSEIGKAIKKLLKFKSDSTDAKITALHEDVTALMLHWTQQAQSEQAKASPKPEVAAKPPTELVAALSDRMVRERGLPSEKEAGAAPGSPRSPAAAAPAPAPSSPRSSGGVKHASPSGTAAVAAAGVSSAPASTKPVMTQNTSKPLVTLDLISKLKSFNNSGSSSNSTSVSDTLSKSASTDSNEGGRESAAMDIAESDDLPRETSVSPFAAGATPTAVESSSPVHMQVSAEDLTEQMDFVTPAPTPAAAVSEPVATAAAPSVPKLKINIVRDAALAPTAAAGTSSLSSLLSSGAASAASVTGAAAGGKAPPIAAVSRASRKSTDMAEGARKLLASRAAALSEKAAEAAAGAAGGGAAKKEDAPVVRKGGLKKPAADGEVKVKRSIQWADSTEGGILRQIHTIEVEKIKSSTANYKSHKDLVKKEKQLEKETHLSKYQDAMHKNTEWRSPPALKLSVEVLENSGNPVKSAEKEGQTKRLGHVLEVRYLDDSLIPSDPDESLASIDGPPTVDDSQCVIIPWYQPGTEPVMPQSSSSSSSGGGRGGMAMGAMGLNQQQQSGGMMMSMGGNMMMTDFNSNTPMNYNNNNTMGGGGFQGGNNRVGGVFDEMDALISALPLSLQRLDRELLLQIVQDQSLLLALLNFDGSVNESRVAALQERFYRTNGGGGGFNNKNQNVAGNQNFAQQQAFNQNNNSMNSFNLLPSAMGSNDLGSSGQGGAGGGGRLRTRWGDAAPVNSGNNNMMMMDGGMNQGNNGGGGFNNEWSNANVPMMNTSNMGGGNSSSAGSSSGSGNTSQKKVWTMPKSATACRFFNTPKGCQFGDKCGFGHFAASSNPSSSSGPLLEVDDMSSLEPSGAVGGSTRWGPGGLLGAATGAAGGGRRIMGPGGAASGPGSRRMGDFEMGDSDAKRMRL